MSEIFQFGERLPEYGVPVLNEREARAGAGILFFVAIVAFMNAWLTGEFSTVRLVVLAFFADFFIRVLINPKFAPSLVLGRFAVHNQQPEYAGATQKRFAWSIGLALATVMLYLVVFQNIRGPINLLACAVCLLLLFFETAFGICIGCVIYNLFNREKAQLCPGGVCETPVKHDIQRISWSQLLVLVGFLAGTAAAASGVGTRFDPARLQQPAANDLTISNDEAERCKVPAFAIAMGHAEKWKLHNNCN